MSDLEISTSTRETAHSYRLRKSWLLSYASAVVCGSTLFLANGNTNAAAENVYGCSDYAYAGVIGPDTAGGASGTIVEQVEPQVPNGHVAAWVGVGGAGMGPGGKDEWLQTGIYKDYDQAASHLYYEVKLPGYEKAKLVSLGPVVANAAKTFKIQESSPNHWAAYVNGRQRSPVYLLPKSHSSFKPVFTAEQWGGSNPSNTCNTYNFKFTDLKVRRNDSPTFNALSGASRLVLPGFKLSLDTPNSFVASNS
jgi:hypothetical protein